MLASNYHCDPRASTCAAGTSTARRSRRRSTRPGIPATYERASDEHGRLGISGATNRFNIGDKVRLIPGHCDPTVNLYDWYVCIHANRASQQPIAASGQLLARSRPLSRQERYQLKRRIVSRHR